MAKTSLHSRYFSIGGALFFLLFSFQGFCTSEPFRLQETEYPTDHSEKETDSLCIAYIGNMGILIVSKDNVILIDGLHKKYKPTYSYPLERTVEELINGEYQNFGKIDLALVTHHHKDHFDSEYYKSFLQKNPESIVIGPKQVTDAIRNRSNDDTLTNGNALKQIPYESEEHLTINPDLNVEAFKCPHVNRARHATVQNMAYFVSVNNYTILHLGDTNWDEAASVISKKKISSTSLDIAILPYWMLLEKSSIERVNNLIPAKRIIATHIPPDFGDMEYKALKKSHPNMILFTTLNEKVQYK